MSIRVTAILVAAIFALGACGSSEEHHEEEAVHGEMRPVEESHDEGEAHEEETHEEEMAHEVADHDESPADPAPVLFAAVAQDGDTANGIVFNQAAFEAKRIAALKRQVQDPAAQAYAPGGFAWYPKSILQEEGETDLAYSHRARGLLEQPWTREGVWLYLDPASPRFDGSAFVSASEGKDQVGNRAVMFAIRESCRGAMKEFTTRYTNREVALTFDGEILSTAMILEPLSDTIMLSRGEGYSAQDVERIVGAFK